MKGPVGVCISEKAMRGRNRSLLSAPAPLVTFFVEVRVHPLTPTSPGQDHRHYVGQLQPRECRWTKLSVGKALGLSAAAALEAPFPFLWRWLHSSPPPFWQSAVPNPLLPSPAVNAPWKPP